VCTPPPIRETIEPNGALTDDYADAYREFRNLYPAIKGALSE
jgi:xylulokinase